MRPFTEADLDWLIEMRTDPLVNRYLGGTRLQNPEAITDRLKFYQRCYDEFGFGQCAMILKETGRPIGASGLQPLEETGEIEVGYSLRPEFWRMGIGFECASAWLEHGFNIAGLPRIVAVCDDKNIGSWRIMEKCGMQFQRTEEHYGMSCRFYSIEKEWFTSAE